MKRWMGMPLAGLLALTACVTINVYFPAAEAKAAAKQFVEKVIGDDAQPVPAKPPADGGGGMAGLGFPHFDPLMLVGIAPAYAQDASHFKLDTPVIQTIEARIDARFDGQLRAGFESGALGFTRDGLVQVRDAGKLQLKDRVAINQAVADDNRDRKAMYREAAVANGHPEWESEVRDIFAKQWIEAARKGWWYQDASGGWKQK
ncbi:MAG: hypothetical protein JWL98_1879 [Xanthomonadaceae bacterium]|nr:hypothetical protein [Xanthomonadaceae bacterium]